LKPGFPFSIRDKNNKRMKIHRKINESQSVNLMPTLERAYNLCLEGKAEKAARLVSEITGLLVAAEIDLGPEYLVEVEVRNAMPRMLSQIRRELKKNTPKFTEEDLQESKNSVNDSHKG
jgi:signal transduction histidine kinase